MLTVVFIGWLGFSSSFAFFIFLHQSCVTFRIRKNKNKAIESIVTIVLSEAERLPFSL
jgi:MFS superfamily sulfate permease-like transporter